jgi:subtilisin family serine protease
MPRFIKKIVIPLFIWGIINAGGSFFIKGGYFPAQTEPEFAPGQIIVKLKSKTTLTEIENLADQFNGEVRKILRYDELYSIKFPVKHVSDIKTAINQGKYEKALELWKKEKEFVYRMIEVFEESGYVEFAQPNYIYRIYYTPNDPYFRDAQGFPNQQPDQYGMFNINAETGWNLVQGGSPDVVIAIIDSGTLLTHPDLSDNIWVNTGETPGNGQDDDGNGYIDDVNGYDFVGDNVGDPWGDDPASEDSDPNINPPPDPAVGDSIDNNFDGYADAAVGHGTHTAGCAATVMDNGTAFAGIAGHCKIMAVRALNAEGSGFTEDIAAAIEYARIAGADVISMSFGMQGSDQAVELALQNAYNDGIALFAATGNTGSSGISFPANLDFVLAVGSFNDDDERSSFSTYGNGLDVVAPGGEAEQTGGPRDEAIWSTYVFSLEDQQQGYGNAGDPALAGMMGTSMACPHAAGLGALILSVNQNFTPDEVYNYIRDGARDIGPSGYDTETGYGAIDVYNTLSPIVTVKEKLSLGSYYGNIIIYERANSVKIISKKGKINVKIVDPVGRKLSSIKGKEIEFPKASLKKGVYFIFIKEPQKVSHKIVVP